MKNTLILTPNRNEMCGMYQLAKDLAKEFNGIIVSKNEEFTFSNVIYQQVITLMYPMHSTGDYLRRTAGLKWICYDQKIPPITKTYFPNFWRRQAMRYINWRNNVTMQGADEYWNITEREQKPRWTKRKPVINWIDENLADKNMPYACYVGRRTDYKNFDWLRKTMNRLGIQFLSSNNNTDDEIWSLISNAKMLVTASLWEGYGRPVMEAEALDIPAVAYDIGAHKRHIKKGICVPLDINNMAKSEELFKKAVLEVWNR